MLGVIRTAYSKGKIVHGDLSEYNVLITDDEPVVIDLAQAVLLDHWRAQELLERDVGNVARYFKKFGVGIDAKDELKRIRSGEFDPD
jgi:RIO kinase 1